MKGIDIMQIIGNKIVNKVDMKKICLHKAYTSGRESDNETKFYSHKMNRVLKEIQCAKG